MEQDKDSLKAKREREVRFSAINLTPINIKEKPQDSKRGSNKSIKHLDNIDNIEEENDLSNHFEKLKNEHQSYKNGIKHIFPGNSLIKENYSKAIAILNSKGSHLKSPEKQKKEFNDILKTFDPKSSNIELLTLYPDFLHHDMLKDLEFRNSQEEIKQQMKTFFIKKFFRLNNQLEKISTKYNLLSNFNMEENSNFKGRRQININKLTKNTKNTKSDEFSIHDTEENETEEFYTDFEKFTGYKNFKVFRLNQEIEHTLQRILRLSTDKELDRTKDFEYYLKHFKLKKLDSIFIKEDQVDTHYDLRIDDYQIYLREITYEMKVKYQLTFFEPRIKYLSFKKGVDIWKNSKILLSNKTMSLYNNKMKALKAIFNNEKSNQDVDIKHMKEYFKNKYSFYYNLKDIIENNNDEIKQITQSYNYDKIYPPFVISINSEIQYYLKELCENFNISFDIGIDKGKAFSYSIDLFYPTYFNNQSENFTFYPYEFTLRDFSQYKYFDKDNSKDSEFKLVNKPSSVLRNKYNLDEGFFVNNNEQSKIYDIINSKKTKNLYLKRSSWINFICVFPSKNHKYEVFLKKINDIGYIDSLIKYEMQLIDVVDLNTLNRLIEEYTSTIKSRVTNTIKLISNKEEKPKIYAFKNLVHDIVSEENARSNDNELRTESYITTNSNYNTNQKYKQENDFSEEYAKKVDGELLKYFLILRFLKIRDIKFQILNLLNYFRYIQKKFTLDCYKIENKSWKKNKDYSFLTNVFSENWSNLSDMKQNKNNEDEIKQNNDKQPFDIFNLNDLINRNPISNHKISNPLVPSLESFLNIAKKSDQDDFYNILVDENDEIVDFSLEKSIRIKDSRGNYIIFDATISDMKFLDELLSKIATYFINIKESLVITTENTPNPLLDRSQIILDIYSCELDFLNTKFELVSELVNTYDNITDLIKQKSMMKIITDIISQRPEIDLDSNYFIISYNLQIEELKKKSAYYYMLSDYQKKLEIEENKAQIAFIEKLFYLYGEVAMNMIKYTQIENWEIEILKKKVNEMKNSGDSYINNEDNKFKEKDNKEGNKILIEEFSELVDLFQVVKEKDNKEKNNLFKNFNIANDDNISVDNHKQAHSIYDSEDDSEVKNSEVSNHLTNDKFNIQQSSENTEEKMVEPTKSTTNKLNKIEQKTMKKISHLIHFLKRLISKSLTGLNVDIDIDNTFDVDELSLLENEFPSIRQTIELSISNASSKKNIYNITSRSNSIPNNSEERLNYKIRSILNLPNPLDSKSYLKYIEENKAVLSELKNEINYIKLIEGFPMKLSESDVLSSSIEQYESLSIIVDLYLLTEESLNQTVSCYEHESIISKYGMHISFYEALIEEWDQFKEFISGRTKCSQFEQLYFLNDTLMDNHQDIMFTIKSLFSTLSSPLDKIPLEIITKLNIPSIQKLKFDELEENNRKFKLSNQNNINNILETNVKNDLIKALNEYVKKEASKPNLDIDISDDSSIFYEGNKQLSEINLYCNLLEVFRTKQVLMKVVNNYIHLNDIYEMQKEEILNRQEDMLRLPNPFIFENLNKFTNSNYVDFADKKFMNKEKFYITEFDQSLEQCTNFNNIIVNYMNILKPTELKTLVMHEYLQYYLLLTAVQYNNVIYQPFSQCLAELDMIYTHNITCYHRKQDITVLFNSKEPLELCIHQAKSKLKSKLSLLGSEHFYRINLKKQKNRNNIIEKYQIFSEEQIKSSVKHLTIKRIMLREYRLNLCISYCKDILIDVYLDNIKLQSIKAANRLRDLVNLIPKEYQVFDINNSSILNYEQHKSYQVNTNFLFFTDCTFHFNKFYIPSEIEILSMESQTDNDVIYHYTHFNPFNLTDDIRIDKFYKQLQSNFSKVSYNNLENMNKTSLFRTIFFDQALDFKSNLLILLKFTTFYTIFFEVKLAELSFSQKQNEIIKLFDCKDKSIDFWGDKGQSIDIFKESEMGKRLPIIIVEKIVQNETNYLNLRHDFIQIQEDLTNVTKDLKGLLKYMEEDNSNSKSLLYIKNISSSHENGKELKETENIEEQTNEHVIKEESISTESNKPIEVKNKSSPIYSFMELTITIQIKALVIVLSKIRERELLKNNNKNTYWINKILYSLGASNQFFSPCDCKNPCHLDIELENMESQENSIRVYNNYANSNQYTPQYINFNTLFDNHFTYFSHQDHSGSVQINSHKIFPHKSLLNNNKGSYSELNKYLLCLNPMMYNDIRSSLFKIHNNTEKYMIFREANRHNNDIISLFEKKLNFMNILLAVIENKLKYIILTSGINISAINCSQFIAYIKEIIDKIYKPIDLNFIFDDILSEKELNESQNFDFDNSYLKSIINQRKDPNPKVVLNAINEEAQKNNIKPLLSEKDKTNKKDENDEDNIEKIKILLDQNKEHSVKLENTELFNNFFQNVNILNRQYKKTLLIYLYNKSFTNLKIENQSIKEVFANCKSELDITMFRNKHSASILKEIDDSHLANINKMFYFFETFVNKLLNTSIEVETHSMTSAYIINKNEFETYISELIRDFVLFNSVLRKQENYNLAVEKYGAAFTIKKLSFFLSATKNKLNTYEDSIEKITNAKLAMNGNKLIYEMDNLYKQLKILKENLLIMEDYIQTYFKEKFYYITSKLKNEISEIENKFQLFKNDIQFKTTLSITDEYNNCLKELKNRMFFLTQQQVELSNSMINRQINMPISDSSTSFNNNANIDIEENFLDHFYREIEIETNYNKDVNVQRAKNDKLNMQLNQLHAYYRIRMFQMKKNYDQEMDSMKQKLSSNQDLWEKLSVAEKNESILKEELAKTQRNLASDEEFIKKLQSQIRILHDKNVTIEKKLSSIAAQDIINSANQGENVKTRELYNETKSSYIYNLKNNIGLLNSIEALKKTKSPEALLVIESLDNLHSKFCQEIDNKRTYINSLNAIKQDIMNMKELNKMKLSEASEKIKKLNDTNDELRREIEQIKLFCNCDKNKNKHNFNKTSNEIVQELHNRVRKNDNNDKKDYDYKINLNKLDFQLKRPKDILIETRENKNNVLRLSGLNSLAISKFK